MTYYIQNLHGSYTPRLLGFAADGILEVYGWERQGGGWTIDRAVGHFRNAVKLKDAESDDHCRPADQAEVTAIFLQSTNISF